MTSFNQIVRPIFIVSILLFFPTSIMAQTSSSNNYQIEEAQFGTGGEVESCSGNQFCAHSSTGSLGVGGTSSTNYDATGGFLTDNAPFLEMVVGTTSVDLGTLETSTTATGNASFSIRTYVSEAYSVFTASPPPTNNNAQLDPMGTPSASVPGTEQFGINLVDNSDPDIGVNPVNQPDNTFADGEAASGYDTSNQFKYNQGDVIARSAATAGTQAVGLTDYTISYIANASSITEGGIYTMNHILVVVPTF
jgi:hypothetical protein